jgi:hypothetical protein
MSISPARSQAIARLREAVIVRCNHTIQTIAERENAKKEIHNACVGCYKEGISRTQVQVIVKAIVSEFQIAEPEKA